MLPSRVRPLCFIIWCHVGGDEDFICFVFTLAPRQEELELLPPVTTKKEGEEEEGEAEEEEEEGGDCVQNWKREQLRRKIQFFTATVLQYFMSRFSSDSDVVNVY